MALPAGRVGVAPDQVDIKGNIKLPPPLPTAKGMFSQVKEPGQSYQYDSDTLVTFIINNNAEPVTVEYTPTDSIGKLTLNVASATNSDGNFDCIFTLWVPKNVSVQIVNQSVTIKIIATIF